jgi:hypothetical protein
MDKEGKEVEGIFSRKIHLKTDKERLLAIVILFIIGLMFICFISMLPPIP